MTEREALKLAEISPYLEGGERGIWIMDAAAELRRLHEVNQDLLEALKEHSLLMDVIVPLDLWSDIRKRTRAAIAKATGETK